MQYGEQFRFNGHHRDCGAKFSVIAEVVKIPEMPFIAYKELYADRTFPTARNGAHAIEYTCRCGKVLYARPVLWKHVPHKMHLPCSAKCLGASGHQCDCSCRGKNHGAGH